MPDHEQARSWLSAFRDGEAAEDPAARAHLDGCAGCRAWAAGLGEVDRAVAAARASGSPPDVTSAAVAAFRGARTPRATAARSVLALAGASGLLLAAVTLLGPDGAGHALRDLLGFQVAFAVGFLLCSINPARYSRALLPLTAAAGLVVLLPSATDVGTGTALLREASHLPMLVGLAGLLLLQDKSGRRRRTPPTMAS